MGTWARRCAAAAAAITAALLVATPAAAADPAGDAVTHLRTSNLYIAPGLPAVRVAPAVAAGLPGDLKIVVLPANAGLPITLAGQIDRRLGASHGHPLTVGVFTVGGPGQVTLRAASSKYCPGVADAQAQAAASTDQALLANADLSSTIHDFAARLSGAKLDRGPCSTATKADTGDPSAGAVWAWTVGIAVVGGAAIGALVLFSRRRRRNSPDYGPVDGPEAELSSVLSGALFGDRDRDRDDPGYEHGDRTGREAGAASGRGGDGSVRGEFTG
jgi:hypothetical protein